MLSLTTVEGDVVLDPLAGVGSVPAMAEAMGRVGYGLELTVAYKQFYEHIATQLTVSCLTSEKATTVGKCSERRLLSFGC